MELTEQEIHIWSSKLDLSDVDIEKANTVLSADEKARAQRLILPLHRYRFIAARSMLRHVLAAYTNSSPEKLSFQYTEHRKPSLFLHLDKPIEFNLSHSHDRALLAINLLHPIGIDIEKIKDTYEEGIVERYFSEAERKSFKMLNKQQQLVCFYRIWAKKEAIIKANGKGLSIPLASLSVSTQDETEIVHLENAEWLITPINTDPAFQAALASHPSHQRITYFEYPAT